jgi:hypothetical protein
MRARAAMEATKPNSDTSSAPSVRRKEKTVATGRAANGHALSNGETLPAPSDILPATNGTAKLNHPASPAHATGSSEANEATQTQSRHASFDPTAYSHLRDQALHHEALQQLRMATHNRGVIKQARTKETRNRKIPKCERRYQTSLHEANVEALAKAEQEAMKQLVAMYEAIVPPGIVAWQQRTSGIGAPSLAKFLGYLGHPRIATPWRRMETPPLGHACETVGVGRCAKGKHLVAEPPFLRTVGQLWAFCGIGDPGRMPAKGMNQEAMLAMGKPMLKKLAWRLASQQVKVVRVDQTRGDAHGSCDPQRPHGIDPREPAATHDGGEGQIRHGGGGYRAVYDDARMKYADRTHAMPCIRCGKTKQPAAIGTPWKSAHQHAAAIRFVAKRMLRDLWIACESMPMPGAISYEAAASTRATPPLPKWATKTKMNAAAAGIAHSD